MQSSTLFRRSRQQLSFWYAGVMGAILALSAAGVYETIDHAHRTTVDRELESVAGALHDSLETTLRIPGELEAASLQVLPSLCGEDGNCPALFGTHAHDHRSTFTREDYYIRLNDTTGIQVAWAGAERQEFPQTLPTGRWAFLQDTDGDRYRQLTLTLETLDNRPWGTLQVGRSLQDFDDYLTVVRWTMILSLPIAMLLVAVASWWLAGRAMQPIYRSYHQIQQFTADAAHELRTPLAATQATIESFLRLPQLPEAEARDALKVLGRQNQRLASLVQDLLLLSRLDAQAPRNWQPCNLQDIVCDLEEELAALALAKQVTLQVESDRPLQVMGNEEQLYRAAFNLVTNAIQHSPPNGTVAISLAECDRQALLQVRDAGVGIAPEHQEKIFDRFYRIASDRSRHTGGSGLGLSIARAIARAHKGNIHVRSEPNKGSTFALQLPAIHHA